MEWQPKLSALKNLVTHGTLQNLIAKGVSTFFLERVQRGLTRDTLPDETMSPLYYAPSVSAWVQRLSIFPRSRRGFLPQKAKTPRASNDGTPTGF
jgi:hypothetical protein